MTLKPLAAHQLYVSGLSADMASHYKDTTHLVNSHVVQAIFEPLNDTPMVMVWWAFGGYNLTPRTSIRIFDTETTELSPAWE